MSKDLTEALDALSNQRNTANDKPKPRGSAPRQVSAAAPGSKPNSGSGSGGIASPLTEGSFASRLYWPTAWKSTDGLFTFPAIKQIQMTDADGAPVTMNFASPPTTP